MRSRWRATVFGLIAIVAALAGTVLHFEAHSGGVEPAMEDPLQIGVYLADPSIPITVSVELRRDEDLRRIATIFVRAPLHTRMIITSSLPSTEKVNPNFRRLPDRQAGAEEFSYFAVSDNSLAPPTEDPRGYALGEFLLPNDVFVQDGGSAAVRMPTIAVNEDGTQYFPGLASVDDFMSFPTTLYAFPLLQKPGYRAGDRVPSHYLSYSNKAAHFTELFWQPEKLTTTETIDGLGELPNARLDVVAPFNGTATADKFVWTGSYGLSGVLVATDRGLQDKLANYEFLSGVALATFAAATVALVQEGSDRIYWPWKKPPPPPTRPRPRQSVEAGARARRRELRRPY